MRGREMGFTFVDSIALYACLIAWEKGKIMEIDEAIDAMKSSSTKFGLNGLAIREEHVLMTNLMVGSREVSPMNWLNIWNQGD